MSRSTGRKLLRIINSVAPMRVCDNGGWTDTWFARHGQVLNIAVYPYAEVQMRVYRDVGRRARITINAENFRQRYSIADPRGLYDKHPLLEAAIDYMKVPAGIAIEVSIYSQAPSGCSTGTSAAVSVALIGALDLLTPGRMTPHEVAAAAHRIETELLHQQCGIQDQVASAFGGINFIKITDYPHYTVSQVPASDRTWWELDNRLVLVYIGSAHKSTEVHRMVIAQLERAGSEAATLRPLRLTAQMSHDALVAGDLAKFGKAMIRNTQAQGRLHESLIGPGHRRIIDIARRHGAIGWKVNGAGGSGGSVSILCGADQSVKRAMIRQIEQADKSFRYIPTHLCRHGLRVWESPCDSP